MNYYNTQYIFESNQKFPLSTYIYRGFFVCSFYEIAECKERDREGHRKIEQKTEQKEKK